MTKTQKWFVTIMMTLAACAALGGAIHTWNSGDTLTSADLNANFQHIHNLMVGGHGARLVDADVSGSAAISSSKLAAYRFIPRAWGSATCDGGTCGTGVNEGITSISKTGTGAASVTLNYTPTDKTYTVVVGGSGGQAGVTSNIYTVSTLSTTGPQFTVYSYGVPGATAVDGSFSFVVYDDN